MLCLSANNSAFQTWLIFHPAFLLKSFVACSLISLLAADFKKMDWDVPEGRNTIFKAHHPYVKILCEGIYF